MILKKLSNDVFGTIYPTVRSYYGNRTPIIEQLQKIKNGYYKPLVAPCRVAFQSNKTLYHNLKTNLPAITFCGSFKGAHKKGNLEAYNNIIIIDLDHITSEQILNIKSKLLSDKYVFACWISPSGAGLKILVQIQSSAAMHKFCFDRIVDYLYANYDIEADVSGSDICRLCYVSDDPEAMLKESSEVFPIQEDDWFLEAYKSEKNVVGVSSNSIIENNIDIYSQSEKKLFFQTERRNKRIHREQSEKIYKYLKKNDKSITRTYHNWLKVALAVSNAFTFDIGKNIFLKFCRLDAHLHDEYKSECLLQYCYRKRKINEINFATIIFLAVQEGFIVNLSKNINSV